MALYWENGNGRPLSSLDAELHVWPKQGPPACLLAQQSLFFITRSLDSLRSILGESRGISPLEPLGRIVRGSVGDPSLDCLEF